MLLFRWIIFLCLIAAGVSFVFYVGTGQPRFKLFGLLVLKWLVIVGLVGFGILILERI
jgi:hypothetical protein